MVNLEKSQGISLKTLDLQVLQWMKSAESTFQPPECIMSFTLWMWKGFVHTAEFDDHNEDKINDNRCLDFVHRNAFMKWDGGNKN